MESPAPDSEPIATPVKPLEEMVSDILSGSPKPLPFPGVKKALSAAGVPLRGKDKVGDDAIQSVIDAAIAAGTVFSHPSKKEGGSPAYWHKPHVTKAELAAEKARERASKVEEKARAKSTEAEAKATRKAEEVAEAARQKALKVEEKARAKSAEAEAKATRKAEEAAEAARQKAASVVETVHRKAAELGHKPVADKHLGKPKPRAGEAEHEAFRSALESLLAEGKLHRHGDKYGKHALVVTPWYEARPLKKPFDEALKAARVILDSGKADFAEFTAVLGAKLDEPRPNEVAPAETERARPQSVTGTAEREADCGV